MAPTVAQTSLQSQAPPPTPDVFDQIHSESAGGGDVFDQIHSEAAKPAPRTWLDSATDAAKEIWNKVNPVTAAQGVVQLGEHPVDTYKADATTRQAILDKAEKSFKGGDYAGGMAHALNGIIPFLGPQMDEAGENFASGQTAKGVGQSVGIGLNLSTPALVKGASAAMRAVPGVTDAADALSRHAYQSALKPPPGSSSLSQVNSMVDTGLKNAIPISEGGVAKLSDLVSDLHDKTIAQIKAGSSTGATVNKFNVVSRLAPTAAKFATQANPEADMAAISNSGNEFLRNQPTDIPAIDAQNVKSGTYKQLNSKAYGELSSATVESQKALARGIKEELETQFPEIKGLNANEGQLLGLQPALERAVRRINNKDLYSLGGKIISGSVGTALGSATGSPAAAAIGGAGSLALHYVMTDPFVQSKLAIGLSRASKGTLPISVAQARVAGYVNALGNAAKQPSPGDPNTQQ